MTIINELRWSLVSHLMGKERFAQNSIHTCFMARDVINYPLFKYMTSNVAMHEHLNTLYMLAIERNLKTMVELGTDVGDSTVALLMAAKRINGMVHSFDIAPCETAKRRVNELGLEKYWRFTRGDDLDAKWDKPIDMLFVDADHAYEHVKGELERFEPYVKRGGIITMHDVVTATMQGTRDRGKYTMPDNVPEAVRDYFEGRSDVHIYEYLNGGGLFVIFKQ